MEFSRIVSRPIQIMYRRLLVKYLYLCPFVSPFVNRRRASFIREPPILKEGGGGRERRDVPNVILPRYLVIQVYVRFSFVQLDRGGISPSSLIKDF